MTDTQFAACVRISIHGPRVGADQIGTVSSSIRYLFQSTAPVWGPTHRESKDLPGRKEFQSTAPVWGPTHCTPMPSSEKQISIHGPRVGADQGSHCFHRPSNYFNPRPPCGGRPVHPGAGAVQGNISIHGPRVGADAAAPIVFTARNLFQSTAPVWGPTSGAPTALPTWKFQSTAPVWGPTHPAADFP